MWQVYGNQWSAAWVVPDDSAPEIELTTWSALRLRWLGIDRKLDNFSAKLASQLGSLRVKPDLATSSEMFSCRVDPDLWGAQLRYAPDLRPKNTGN